MTGLVVENTPMWFDIEDIIKLPSEQFKHEIRAMLHTEKEDLVILHLRSEQYSADYVNDYCEEYYVEFEMPLGDYAFRLYPYRGNLEFTVKMIEQVETGSNRKTERPVFQQRYKAIFLAKENPALASSELDTLNYDTLNLKGTIRVKLQLLHLSIEPLRIKMLTGNTNIYRNVTPEDLIRSVLYSYSNEIKLNNKAIVDAIDIYPPDNKDLRTQYLLPHKLMLTDFTNYLQDVEGGVYMHGMGTFFQNWKGKNTWFVYPVYRVDDLFNSSDDNIIFYNLPKSRFPGLDRTYKTDNKTTRVLITSDQNYKDSGEAVFMNNGTGIRYTEARAIIKKPLDLDGDGVVARRNRLNNEVALLERKDGLNFAPFSKDAISANPYKQFTEVHKRNLARVDLTWENSNPLLIKPNMACKYVFIKDNQVISLKAVIAQHETYTTHQGAGINQTTYRNVTHLVLYVERYTQTKSTNQSAYEGEF